MAASAHRGRAMAASAPRSRAMAASAPRSRAMAASAPRSRAMVQNPDRYDDCAAQLSPVAHCGAHVRRQQPADQPGRQQLHSPAQRHHRRLGHARPVAEWDVVRGPQRHGEGQRSERPDADARRVGGGWPGARRGPRGVGVGSGHEPGHRAPTHVGEPGRRALVHVGEPGHRAPATRWLRRLGPSGVRGGPSSSGASRGRGPASRGPPR